MILGDGWYYIYTMKVGSTSLIEYLGKYGKNMEVNHDGPRKRISPVHFAVVRNPYARAVSMWKYESKGRLWSEYRAKNKLSNSLENFCRHGLLEKKAIHGKYDFKNPKMRWPQKKWMDQFVIDKVIHLENLEEELSEILGFEAEVEKKNSTGGNWEEELTPDSIKMINNWAEHDFQYGYEKREAPGI